jgi:ERF superfamily
MADTLHDKLVDIQQRLKVPKDQHNSFGGFDFRNIEGIEAAVKPLLKEHNVALCFTDTVAEIAGRFYIKATAVLSDGENRIEIEGWARETETKKGSDESQITGAASSYARKYAAGGLFLIDNGKDADSMDNMEQKAPKRAAAAVSNGSIRFASTKSIDWMRDAAEKYVPVDTDTDAWIESVLTIPPAQVPQFKVKDAVDKLNEVGMAQSKVLHQQLDTVITDLPDVINLEDTPY